MSGYGRDALPEGFKDVLILRKPINEADLIGDPDQVAERQILRHSAEPALDKVRPVISSDDLLHLQETVGHVAVDEALVDYMLAIVKHTREHEALAMGVKAGLDPKILLDIINVSSGRNSATQDKFPRSVLPGTFDFGFATALSYKDVRLCLDEAEAMGIPMIMGAVVRQILALTQAKYGPDSDFTSIAKLSEEWAGVEIRG